MAAIYIKINEADVPNFHTRMRALGLANRTSLIENGLQIIDKALLGRLQRDPDNASEDLKAACELPPLKVQEVVITSIGGAKSGADKLRTLPRAGDPVEKLRA